MAKDSSLQDILFTFLEICPMVENLKKFRITSANSNSFKVNFLIKQNTLCFVAFPFIK